MEGDGFKDGRPTEETQLAEEKPMEEPLNQNPPQAGSASCQGRS